MTFKSNQTIKTTKTVKTNIVIIGAGSIIHDAHLPAYKRLKLPVKGIFDINKSKAETLAKKFGIPKVYVSMLELWEDFSFATDIIDLAVPADKIISIIKDFPKNIYVLVQKPMGTNLKDATAIAKIFKAKNIRGAINFQLRYMPQIIEAKRMIDAGEIGELTDISFMIDVFMPWSTWKFMEGIPRMEILYHSIHYLDLIRFFLGNPKSVMARTFKEASQPKLASVKTTCIIDYGDYLRAVINTYHSHIFGIEKQESYVRFIGSKGAIQVQLGVNLNYPHGGKNTFEYFKTTGRKSEKSNGWQKKNIPGGWFIEAFVNGMRAFVQYKENNKRVSNHYLDSLETMRVVEAAYIASEQKRILSLKQVK